MQSQERDLISGLFGRLQQFESQPRDRRGRGADLELGRAPAGGALSAGADRAGPGAGAEGGAGAHRRARSQGECRAGRGAELPRQCAEDQPVGRAAQAARRPRRGLPCPSTRSPLQAAVAPPRRAGGRQLPAHGDGDGSRRGRRRPAVRGHPQHDGQQSVRPAAGRGASRAPLPDARSSSRRSAQDDSQAADGGASEDYDTASLDQDDGQDMGGGDDDSCA